MSKLPIEDYLSDATRTEAQMKTEFENIRDVIAELGGGYTANSGSTWTVETLTIGTDAITVPTSQFVKVTSFGAPASDILTKITTTDLTDGRIIYLSNSSSTATYDDATGASSNDYITITHNSNPTLAQIKLATGANWHLAGKRVLVLVLRNSAVAAYWEEVGRFYGGDSVSERSGLGLGTAATETMATGVGASAQGKVLKTSSSSAGSPTTGDSLEINAAGDIVFVESTGGDADTLAPDSIDSRDVIRGTNAGDAVTAQSMTSSLSVKTTAIIDQASADGDGDLLFKNNGIEKAKLTSIGTGNITALHAMTGAGGAETVKGGIQIDALNSTVSARNSTEAWSPILTEASDPNNFPSLSDFQSGTNIPQVGGYWEHAGLLLVWDVVPGEGVDVVETTGSSASHVYARAFAQPPFIIHNNTNTTESYFSTHPMTAMKNEAGAPSPGFAKGYDVNFVTSTTTLTVTATAHSSWNSTLQINMSPDGWFFLAIGAPA